MKRVNLIGDFGCLVGKNEIQPHLIALIDHRSLARHHAPDMEADGERNGAKVLLNSSDERFSGVGDFGVREKNYKRREHGRWF